MYVYTLVHTQGDDSDGKWAMMAMGDDGYDGDG
jgi:hypothetical protein